MKELLSLQATVANSFMTLRTKYIYRLLFGVFLTLKTQGFRGRLGFIKRNMTSGCLYKNLSAILQLLVVTC